LVSDNPEARRPAQVISKKTLSRLRVVTGNYSGIINPGLKRAGIYYFVKAIRGAS